MALSRCNVFSREDKRCGLTAEHPGRNHAFGPTPPGPPDPPPAPALGQRYETDEEFWRRVPRCLECASLAHSKCSGAAHCSCIDVAHASWEG